MTGFETATRTWQALVLPTTPHPHWGDHRDLNSNLEFGRLGGYRYTMVAGLVTGVVGADFPKGTCNLLFTLAAALPIELHQHEKKNKIVPEPALTKFNRSTQGSKVSRCFVHLLHCWA